jgi:hypothetical protein
MYPSKQTSGINVQNVWMIFLKFEEELAAFKGD